MVLKSGCDLAQQAARIQAFDFFEVSGWKVRDLPCGTGNTKTNRYNNPDRGGDGEWAVTITIKQAVGEFFRRRKEQCQHQKPKAGRPYGAKKLAKTINPSPVKVVLRHLCTQGKMRNVIKRQK